MSRKVKRDRWANIPPKVPQEHSRRVDPASNMALYVYYNADEFVIAGYEGQNGDFVQTVVGGRKKVLQYCRSGELHRKWGDQPTEIYRAGDLRDTFSQSVKDTPTRYTARGQDTAWLCINFLRRSDFPYQFHKLKDGERVSVLGPQSDGRDKLLITLKGVIDWLDDDDKPIDRQDGEIDHRELGQGDNAVGVAIGETHFLVVE